MYIFHRNHQFEIDECIQGSAGQEYELQEEIDSGGNGVVHKCVEASTGEEFAIKFQMVLSKKRLKRFKRELTFMKAVEHTQLMNALDEGVVHAFYKKGAATKRTKLPFIIMPLSTHKNGTAL